jgi:hypothetical protein
MQWKEVGTKIFNGWSNMKRTPLTYSSAFGIFIMGMNAYNIKYSPLYKSQEDNIINELKFGAVCGVKGIIYAETYPLSLLYTLNMSDNHFIAMGSFRK